MPETVRYSPELAEVVTAVIGDLSLEQAAYKLDYALTAMTLSRLKRGKPGLEQTVRKFARGFASRICELFGDRIEARFGVTCDPHNPDPELVGDWLADLTGFRIHRPVTAALATDNGHSGRSDEEFITRVAQRAVAEALRAAGVTPHQPGGREAFWQIFGDAFERADREGVFVHPPTHNEESPVWDTLTADDAQRMVRRLVLKAYERAGRPAPEWLPEVAGS